MAYSYTLSNIRASVRAILREATASFWTDAMLNAYINEAVSTIAIQGGCIRETKSLSTTPNERLISFDGYKCLAVEYNEIALIKITPLQSGHTQQDGIMPQYWYEFGDYIGIEPIPADTYSLTAYVVESPATLSGDSDTPEIPYALCGLITYYAAAMALYQDRKINAAAMLMSIFYSELDFMTKSILINVPDGYDDLRFH